MKEKKELYTFTCYFCGANVEILAYPSDMEKYKRGEGLIQDIFPYLTPGEREIMISGLCEHCFNSI